MNQLEKEQKLSELRQEKSKGITRLEMLEDEIRALEATPVTIPHKAWEPTEETEFVWYTQDKCRKHWTLCPTYQKELALALGMVQPSEEAAERHHSFLVMLHDLHKFAVEHNKVWEPDWNNEDEYKYSVGLDYSGPYNGKLLATTWYSGFNNVLPYFKSKELAQKAIDTFGDRLKILFEYYNS